MTFSKQYALILAGRYDVDGNEEPSRLEPWQTN
jgi:hypothetical protein